MHKFVYPLSDTYVTNHPDVLGRNFGRDEILEISSEKISIRSFESASFRSANTSFVGLDLKNFNGNPLLCACFTIAFLKRVINLMASDVVVFAGKNLLTALPSKFGLSFESSSSAMDISSLLGS